MKVDVKASVYQEADNAKDEFSSQELRRLRYLLRRLRFLEAQINKTGGLKSSGNDGAAFAEWEVEALEWVLTDMGFLQERVRR